VGNCGAKWWKGGHNVFLGQYEHALDDKGRLFMPAKFRDKLGTNFVVTKGLDRCLFIYPAAEWESIESKLQSLPFTKSDARSFSRMFFSGAAECECDKQGRVNLPSSLREYAQLEKETVIIGVASRVEIWGKEQWIRYSEGALDDYERIAEELEDVF
jgi:MraZ protein